MHDDSIKNVIFKTFFFFFLVFWKFLNYLICIPSFKSLNSSSLSRKNYDGGNFHFHPRRPVRGTDTLVGIELTELNDILNYKLSFTHCILQTVLHVFLLLIFMWIKNLLLQQLSNILYLFDLFWDVIRCYSIKDSLFLVLFLKD